MSPGPDPSLVTRFVADFVAIGGEIEQRIGLAVSGGPDSVALLLLAHAAGLDIAAATVDHGLRPAAAAEANFVAGLCHSLGVPHATLNLGPPDRGNLSNWARRERYRALGEWTAASGIAVILTAHHADDQLETMLLRLNRGSGVAGLAGVRARRRGILRPLLGWRRSELIGIVRDCGIAPVDDPTNHDDAYDRTRLRKALADTDWLDPVAASRSAGALADAEDALAWTARKMLRRRVTRADGTVSFAPGRLPHELVRRILLACLREIAPGADPRGEALERAIAALRKGETITLAGVKCSGAAIWSFEPAPPRRASTSGS